MKKPNLTPLQKITNENGIPEKVFFELMVAMINELGGFAYQGVDPIMQFGEGSPVGVLDSGHFYRDTTSGAEQTYHFKSGTWVQL